MHRCASELKCWWDKRGQFGTDGDRLIQSGTLGDRLRQLATLCHKKPQEATEGNKRQQLATTSDENWRKGWRSAAYVEVVRRYWCKGAGKSNSLWGEKGADRCNVEQLGIERCRWVHSGRLRNRREHEEWNLARGNGLTAGYWNIKEGAASCAFCAKSSQRGSYGVALFS